jgi:mannose-6-phosphate isomerase-like protein (cupin superfamily)
MSEATIRLGDHEALHVLHDDADLLAMEATYEPGGSPPPAHYHPSQDEHFEVLEGSVRVRTPDGERALGAGETIDIPRGTTHQFWNPGGAPARVRWEVRPALRTAEFFQTLYSGNAGETFLQDFADEIRFT